MGHTWSPPDPTPNEEWAPRQPGNALAAGLATLLSDDHRWLTAPVAVSTRRTKVVGRDDERPMPHRLGLPRPISSPSVSAPRSGADVTLDALDDPDVSLAKESAR